jgi:hypothetical protein
VKASTSKTEAAPAIRFHQGVSAVARFAGLALLAVSLAVATAHAAEAPLVLENDQVRLEVDPACGTLERVLDKASGIALAAAPVLAENFRLTLLLPDKKTLTILGKDQKLSGVNRTAAGLTLNWGGPLKDTAGAEHKLAVRMEIKAAGNELQFGLHLDNGSAYKVREVCYPLIGGLDKFGVPGQPADGVLWAPTSKPTTKKLAVPFGAATFAYPGQANMSFTCIQSAAAKKSLYFSSHDPIARYKVYHFQERSHETNKSVFAYVQHHPFTPPGKTFDGSTVVLKVVDGDWHAAGRVYREFFINTFGLADLKTDWIRKQSFFLMTMFMLPEGTINYTFKDIPRWAKAAKEHGVNAVQISGWQVGGHDNGYPYYIPDPRLGTWQELEDGIKACHKMGLKVFFFVNYQPMMQEADWYKKDLVQYREWNAEGGLTWNTGWGMGTLWARMGNPKLETWADLGFPQFRKIITDQFEALAKIGADGVHVDKMFPAGISYNPNSPMSPDTSTWEGAILQSKEILAACRKHNPDWAMSFECNWDRMLQFGGCTWWVGNQAITRAVFPENAETLAIGNAYDYLGINNAVRNGHHVMLAPLAFARGMDWPPFAGLNNHIRDVKRIQDQLQETVFLGEVLGQAGVQLTGQPAQGVEYNVFRNRRTALRACILTSSSSEPRTQTLAGFDGAAVPSARVHQPGRKSYVVNLPATLTIPAEQIMFVEELAQRAETTAPKAVASSANQAQTIPNGAFETGGFEGWKADPNWVIANDARVHYAGWQGKYWAWSGGTGESAVGKLTSQPFKLDKDGVAFLISGWNSIHGTGSPREWNYVTLNLADGTELDRVYAPNTTSFVSAFLDGAKHKGQMVYVQAVDDADQPAFAMLCLDDVRTANLPADYAATLPPRPAGRAVVLEDEHIQIGVNRKNGSVTRIHDKKTGLDLILEPRLAGSWKFAFPLPGKEPWQTIEANWIFGRQQKLSSFHLADKTLTLKWDGPLKNYLGETYNASVTETIELTEGGALFNLTIENHTPYQVGETYYPVLGGLQGLGTQRGQLKATEFVRPTTNGATAKADIFRSFGNMTAFGDQGPEQFYAYPATLSEPWVALRNAKLGRSVYIGAHDPADRKKVARLELIPSGSGTARDDGNWPRPSELKGAPVGVEFTFVDCHGGAAGKNYQAAPVFIKFHDNKGPEAQNIYKQWKDKVQHP